jgi:hypothetical protein
MEISEDKNAKLLIEPIGVFFNHIPVKVLHNSQPKDPMSELVLKNAVVTIAYQVVDGQLEYGASYCAPCDQFSRKRGRQIAEGRMKDSPILITKWSDSSTMLEEVTAAALETLPCRWDTVIAS